MVSVSYERIKGIRFWGLNNWKDDVYVLEGVSFRRLGGLQTSELGFEYEWLRCLLNSEGNVLKAQVVRIWL